MPPSVPTAEPDAAVSVCGLCRNFGARPAVHPISFELRRGEVLGFLGPNGAGKTTVMQMLAGVLAPSGGAIRICGIDLLRQPVAAKAQLGYLPDTPPLYRELTVDEYLALAAKLRRVARAEIESAVEAAKLRCGLAQDGKRLIGRLSKGYRQRVGIAQAIVHDPPVVILDEPTGGLDPNQIREIRGLIRELGRRCGVILSTHVLGEAESVSDRVQILHRGNLVYGGTVAEFRRMQRGRGLLVGLRTPPGLEEIAAIPGVAGVERLSETLFRIRHESSDPSEAVVKSATGGWGLYQISPEQTSLEEVFAQLTQGEENQSPG